MLEHIRNNPVRAVLCIVLGLLFIMRADMVFRSEVHWDEFLNLSMVYDYANATLTEALQTAFIHMFTWVPLVSNNEVDQIIAARGVIFIFALVTSLAIYKISKTFMSIEAALFTVIAYWSFTYTLLHGVSFRTDPLATSFMMGALWLTVMNKGGWWRALIAGICIGLAGAMTIKAIFYAPVLIVVGLINYTKKHSIGYAFTMLMVGGVCALVTFLLVIWLHMNSLPEAVSPFAFIERTSSVTVGTMDFNILLYYLLNAAKLNSAFFVLLLGGGYIAVKMAIGKSSRLLGIHLLGLLLLLVSPLLYRDVYPYYYPFMLAPVVVVVGIAFERLLEKSEKKIYIFAAILAIFAPAVIIYGKSSQLGPNEQRRTLAVIHEVFPEPVSYIDGRSMVSSYPKRGIFMSTWGMTDYRAAGRPVMQNILTENKPKFILANVPQLDLDKAESLKLNDHPYGLLDEDLTVLKKNFTHYWGPLYVPGFTLAPNDTVINVYIPGLYQILSGDRITVDGRVISTGETVMLDLGPHQVSQNMDTVLRWHLPVPTDAAPKGYLFHGF